MFNTIRGLNPVLLNMQLWGGIRISC